MQDGRSLSNEFVRRSVFNKILAKPHHLRVPGRKPLMEGQACTPPPQNLINHHLNEPHPTVLGYRVLLSRREACLEGSRSYPSSSSPFYIRKCLVNPCTYERIAAGKRELIVWLPHNQNSPRKTSYQMISKLCSEK